MTDFTYVTGTNRLSSIIIRDQDISGDPVNRTTSFTYWDSSYGYQLKTITDANNNTTTIYYDSTKWYLSSMDPPLGNDWTFTTNDVGDVTSATDGNGNTTSYGYDNLHRVTQVTFPDIGAGQKSQSFTWQCCGLTQVTDENGVVTKYEYDFYTKWLKKVTENYGGTNPSPIVTAYT